MDFRELQYIVTIAEEQSITKAANRLYISQPTLTKFLQKLEKELGQKLFVRVSGHYQPTYAGGRYIERARELLQLKHEMDEEMKDISLSDRSELHIGCPHLRATNLLPPTLPVFERLHPHVKVTVQETDSAVLEDLLLNGTLDVAFFNGSVQKKGLSQEVLCKEDVVLLMHKDHPLAGQGVEGPDRTRPWLDPALLKNDRFLITPKGQKTRQYTDDFFAEQSFTPGDVFEVGSLYTAAALANQNYGLCIMSARQLDAMPHLTDLKQFDIGAPSLYFIAAYRTGGYMSRHARAFIDLVREVVDDAGTGF